MNFSETMLANRLSTRCLVLFLCFCIILRKSDGLRNNLSVEQENKVCTSENCVLSAAIISTSLNNSVDPCDDFYSFACGGWMKKEHISLDVLQSTGLEIYFDIIKMIENIDVDSLPIGTQKAIQAYKVCTKYDTFEDSSVKWMQNFFEEIGGIPLITPDWNQDEYDWIYALTQIVKKLYIFPLLDVDSHEDIRDPSRNMILIGQPLRKQNINVNDHTLLPLLLIKAADPKIEFDKSKLGKEFLDLTIMETELHELRKYVEDVDDISEYEKVVRIKDLQLLNPMMDWIKLFTLLFGDVTEESEILIRNEPYVLRVVELIISGNWTKRTIANFFGLNALVSIMEKFPLAKQHLIANNHIPREVKDSLTFGKEDGVKIVCLHDLIGPLNFAIDHMYITNKQHSKYKLEGMVSNLKSSLKKLMERQQWIDDETKRYVLKKVAKMNVVYDYPSWITDPTKINIFYESLPEITDNALENLVRIRQFLSGISLSLRMHTNDRTKWIPIPGISTSSFNALYFRSLNTIGLPFVLKQLPVFDPNRPQYLNYGAIAMIIGHEMGHAFDKNNIQKDQFGRIKKWTNNYFKKNFLKRTECLIQHYNNYTLDEYGNTVDGKKTLSQNIADITGLRIAYRAYKRLQRIQGNELLLAGLEKYTQEQMLFISFGTSWCETDKATRSYAYNEKSDHSPSKFRVLGTLSNMKEFSKVFKCKKGTNMNKRNKCNIW